MTDTEMTVPIDSETWARLGALATLAGMKTEDVARLVLEQAITEMVDYWLMSNGADR